MANIKSQKKRVLTNEKAHKRNVAVKSGLKTAVRATREAIAAGDKAAAEAAGLKTWVIGDAIQPGKVDQATRSAYLAGIEVGR